MQKSDSFPITSSFFFFHEQCTSCIVYHMPTPKHRNSLNTTELSGSEMAKESGGDEAKRLAPKQT